ncbi:MAG: heme exporter protein CcmB [Rhizobiaceae bacterium]
MRALISREFRLSLRAGTGALTGLLFFLAVVTVVPFGVGPDMKLLARIGPAILWIGALLASLLGLDRLFQIDREDGSLDLMVAGQDLISLSTTVFAKALSHWLTTVLPLIIAAPFLGLILNMEPLAIGGATLTLLIGTPAITFIGAVGAAITVSLPRGGLLVSVLILPLVIPVLIFGVSATSGAIEDTTPFLAPFLILCALTLFFAVLGTLAAAFALKSQD